MKISVVHIIISIVLLGSVVGSKARATTTAYLSEGTAFWTNYNVEQNEWSLNKVNVACASIDGNKPFEWRSKYYWAAFCGNGPSVPSSCGSCLKVTNPKNEASVVVRIVDRCGFRSMGLDEPAFDIIDDGSGKHNGYLTVTYEFVDCDPPPPPPPPPPAGPGEDAVTAYWTDYGPLENNWSYSAARVACNAFNGARPLEWRKKYGWTAYCGTVLGSELKNICGKCLKVTNTDTKDEEIVRIVDSCGSGGLVLDLKTAFSPIDSNGKGIARGHLTVDYQVVDCGDDEVDSPLRLYGQ